MKAATCCVLAACLIVLIAGSAAAGPYTDDLSKCLVRSTSVADRSALTKWLFATIALHPEVSSIATVSEADRDALNRTVARLYERLLTEACLAEAKDAMRYEGPSTIRASFEVLGGVAGQELMTNPAVAQGMMAVVNHIDKQKFADLFRTAP